LGTRQVTPGSKARVDSGVPLVAVPVVVDKAVPVSVLTPLGAGEAVGLAGVDGGAALAPGTSGVTVVGVVVRVGMAVGAAVGVVLGSVTVGQMGSIWPASRAMTARASSRLPAWMPATT
jgi:hypothetical protein